MACITVQHHFSSLIPNICSSTNFGVFYRPKIYTNYNIINGGTKSRLSSACYPIICAVVNSSNAIIDRRSANFEPSIWSFDYIQSLTSQYKEESYTGRVKELEIDVKKMLIEMENSLIQLELIDTLQRLGVSYRFEDEINTILEEKYININNPNYNLYVTALEFRLLRQHGYAVPQEIFNHFKNEIGKIKANMISDDIMEVLALYEASFYEKKGESILEEVRIFTTQCLKNYIIMISQERKLMIDNDNDYDYDIEIVNHALELPLHRRTTRTEAKWFIDAYEKKQDMNPILLEFAKLDFNMIQSTHHDDLKHIFRWWRHTKLGENLNFARDRLMECFLWKVGIRFEPKFSYFRITTAKLFELITVIDDIYDVYGTLDELELFTKAIERWDMEMINELPEYMKMPYIVLHNTINEMVFEVLRDQHISINIDQYLKKTWVDMCRGFLQEAKWYYSGYTPTLEEYIENGWISVGAPVLIVHAYFSHANYNHTVTSSKEIFECFEHGYYPAIIRHSAIILRLTNDLATSSEELKRGDAPTSIQCYMQEKKVSEEKAREHIKFLISEIWKEMNNDVGLYPISLIEDATNFAKMGFFMYQHGDGHSSQDNLYAIALEFRLLRQHGYAVPQEIFNQLKNEIENIKKNINGNDIMGILALYEASFYEKKCESILKEARIFTTECLKNYTIMISEQKKLMIDNDYDYDIEVVNHALELPLHRRTTRTEAKWFIDAYAKKQDMNPMLLELAKLDFNIVQSTHHEDLKHIFRWWRHTKLGEKLNFARDRLMECFLWNIGIRFESKFSYFRTKTAKLFELVTFIDDIYDVYGTLDELELFTKAVERWDVKMINELPEYMKMPYLVLHNTINDMVFEVLRDQEISINIQYLKKTWVDMCKSFLQEAKWYYSGYTPTLEEYIENGWISVGAPVILVHAYFFHANNNRTITNTKEIFECLEYGYYPAIIRHSAIILRFTNDLATSSEELKRGDAPTSIQCYMQEKNVSEEEAREHIKFLINEAWKEMNNDVGLYPISLTEDATNFAKMGFFIYQHGDGHSSQDNQSKQKISSLIIEPIPLYT